MDQTPTAEGEARTGARVPIWLRIIALMLLVGLIVQLNSERAYWFYSVDWFTSDLDEMLGTAAFYGMAAAVGLWTLAKVPFRGWYQVVLAGTIFAWTVEGVIVQVLHEAGPLDPFFPAMFAGWHGALSFVGFFYLVRRWLVEHNRTALLLASGAYGLVWGSWAITSWLPDSDQSRDVFATGIPARTEPVEFALMALLLVVTLAVAHLVLDHVWPAGWQPGRLSTWLLVGGTGFLATTTFFAIPWAPFRWFALIAIPGWGLWRSAQGSPGPTLYESLAGRVQAADLWTLLPAAAIAPTIYAVGWYLDPTATSLQELQNIHVLFQMTAGAGLLVVALRKTVQADPASRI